MKTLLIHGSYTSDGLFVMSYLSGDTGGSVNDFNLAMQALRLRGTTAGEEKYLRVIPTVQIFSGSYMEGDERVESNTDWNIH